VESAKTQPGVARLSAASVSDHRVGQVPLFASKCERAAKKPGGDDGNPPEKGRVHMPPFIG
ncbi:MAG: hypothetical protein LC772_09555, partial [Chloroflexi bacterium]|nr:hypothetical protein [Chloroflexota bacterium]